MVTTGSPSAPGEERVDKGLKSGALGLISTTIIATASVAPAYSIAATLVFVVLAVGVQSPIIAILAFVPMLFTSIGYSELNKADPDCGTTFTWATRAFGPRSGWWGGWAIIAADVLVMASLAQVAGQYGFLLFNADGIGSNPSSGWVLLVGCLWIAAMTWICYRGIEVSARLQYALLGIELVVLIAFAVIALVKVHSGSAPEGFVLPGLDWLWPGGLSLSDFVDAVLIAVFLYWGWDTAVAVNEEADDPATTPGRAAVLSTVLLLVTYVLVSVASVAFAGTGTEGIGLGNPDNADDVFAAIAPTVFGDSGFGQVFVVLLIISVLTSSAASTQTTILPTARAALSMGAYRAIPPRFAKIHPRYLTPTWATWGMGIASIAFYVLLTIISTNVLADSISAVGLLIAFYYGLTGFACVWYYRKHLQGRDLWVKGVLPALGGLLLLGAFVEASITYASPDGGETTVFGIGGVFVIGIGSLVLGYLLMFVYSRVAPPFFRGQTLTKGSHDLVLAPGHPAGLLPDSHEETVIAPDLSNLPPGQRPTNPRE